jgi:hypothetical protein
MAYANPDAVTQIANGLSTTTFTYDNNGNVTQKTTDGTTAMPALTNRSKVRGLTDRKMAVVDTYLRGRSFESRDQLVAFAGLDVMARRSGSWRGKERLSKCGSPYLRKVLFHIAWGLSRHNAQYRAYYLKLRGAGKHFMTCMVAVARKFLRFVFAWYFGSLKLSTALAA